MPVLQCRPFPKTAFRYSQLIISKTTNHPSKTFYDEDSDDASAPKHRAGPLIDKAAWLGCCIARFRQALVFARPEEVILPRHP